MLLLTDVPGLLDVGGQRPVELLDAASGDRGGLGETGGRSLLLLLDPPLPPEL